MKKANSKTFTRLQKSELQALARLHDREINTRDIAEVRDWSGAKRGLFYRPIKEQLTLRLDAEIIAWFRGKVRGGKGYQTSINAALREYVAQHEKAPSAKRGRGALRGQGARAS